MLKDIINENMTDAEKVHAVFKWICDNTYYDWEGWESWGERVFVTPELIGTDALSMFTEYGVAINGKAVCDGYAFMFKYFMDSLEIENHYVRSSLPNHAWNQVKINDEWYWVDCTWGDTDEVVNMKYDYQWFLQSGQRVYEGFVVDEHNGTVCDGTHRKEILESLGIDFDTTV